MAVLHPVPVRADDALPSEYQVKAAFIINFAKYVDWPPEAFGNANSPIVLAVAGESKIVDELEKVITGRAVNGRMFVLKHLVSGQEEGEFHILFISASEKDRMAELLGSVKGKSTLTVSETPDFLDHGGMITMVNRDRKIALEVNVTPATGARLKISSRLLSVASVVKGKSN